MRQIYQELTHDSSAARTSEEAKIDERIAAALLDTNDPNIIFDLRKLNGRPKSPLFDDFWQELETYLQEINPAVDERRHGEVCHMPIAISICHLRNMILERLQQKHPDSTKLVVPSEEWIRLQFWPQNPYFSSALRYTGRFDVKYCVQSRQLRKNHPDTHYVSVILQYVKDFAVQYQDITQMVSVDDKCVVPVGEPGDPISTAVRSHNRSMALKASKLAALDHDFHVHGIIPSVSFFVSIPESSKDSFFQGKPYVALKDKITQPSHALRHSVEISSIYKSITNEIQPIMIIVSDGGPDHRLNFLSVQVALICLFSDLQLDFLVCVRTCPYQSWQNLAERVMSTLNLALQNVSLCRKEMSASNEQLIRNKSTIKDVREVISHNEGLKEELRDSIQAPMIAISARIKALTLKGEKFSIHIPASDSEIDQFFDYAHFIEPNLDRGHLRKADMKDAPALKKFMNNHCHISQYVFQIKKCKDASCYYCVNNPVRMPVEVFEELHFFPLPRLDPSKKHYKPFTEMYGKEISECDRPSQVTDENSWIDKENSDLFRNTRVRKCINCQECLKPRCIYAVKVLSWEEKAAIRVIDESHLYTCGSPLFTNESPLHSSVVVRQKLTCSSPIEAQYYSAKLVTMPCVCYWCGGAEETLLFDDLFTQLQREYQVVRPMCFLCKAENKQYFTSHPNNMAKCAKLSN